MVDDISPLSARSASARLGTVLEPQAFADVYRAEMPLLARFVMKHGASPQEAADAAHEAFAQAYENWDRIRYPARWLRTVATRIYFRAKLREDLPGELPSPRAEFHLPTNIELSDQERDVYAALAELPPRQRQVMAWYYDWYTVPEIAEVLSIAEDAVRQSLCRARAALKAHRSQQGGVR
ncbi:RNA polymerase sigma factor (sigma-70 family) [Streptomyces canus]|uniref:RNA polymerase sigma factor n=1 Tax=Streptomyces canus TaxID=58343 RepID=UPI00277EDA3F|nr:sigma-70 family RNA polymerase sigma factor [Streptomyces canus]MDQ0605419.1 RNA polymerase sigma factor (sigma-70 family) [Streptomyces canus]